MIATLISFCVSSSWFCCKCQKERKNIVVDLRRITKFSQDNGNIAMVHKKYSSEQGFSACHCTPVIGAAQSKLPKILNFRPLIQTSSSTQVTNEDVFYILNSAEFANKISLFMPSTSKTIQSSLSHKFGYAWPKHTKCNWHPKEIVRQREFSH